MNAQIIPDRKSPGAVALPYWLDEFGQLRLAVAALLAALACGGAAVIGSASYRAQASASEQLASQARQVAFVRVSQAETEKQEIRSYQPHFLALRNRGLVGPEHRLSWLDGLRQIQERRKLLPLSYEIAPQQAVHADSLSDLGDYQLYASQMRLHLDLLHEMDLLNLLADLKQYGFPTLQDCNIKRQLPAENLTAAATLTADCSLSWITLSAPNPATQKAAP